MRRAEHRSVNVKRLRRGTQALPAGCVCEIAGAAWAGTPAERCGAAVRGSDVSARPGVGRGLESRPRVPPAESGVPRTGTAKASGVEPKPARPAGRLLVRGRPQPLLRPGPRRRWSPP